MKQIDCTPKEAAIYDAVKTLLSKGVDIRDMKISEIAYTAGIGKGTVYEYFSSKEELLIKAIAYNIVKEIETVKEYVAKKDAFKEKFYAVFESVYKNKDRGCIMFNIVSKMPEEIFKNKMLSEKLGEQLLNRIKNFILEFVRIGVEQGVILENNDEEYIMLVAKACLGAYISYICHVKNDEDKHRAIDNTYKLFVKALN